MESRELLHPAAGRSAWLAICRLRTHWKRLGSRESFRIDGKLGGELSLRLLSLSQRRPRGVLGKCTRLGRSGS
jgi:hypothetical protein